MKINYPESKKILDKIKSAKNILINVHRNPDLDSIGSATAKIVYRLLIDWKTNFDKNISTSLLSGIAGDTVFLSIQKIMV